jgi:hypothetical protein
MDEYFGISVGSIRTAQGFKGVYACKKCGALVTLEDREIHVADHEATLKLAYDLHNAAHHHLT